MVTSYLTSLGRVFDDIKDDMMVTGYKKGRLLIVFLDGVLAVSRNLVGSSTHQLSTHHQHLTCQQPPALLFFHAMNPSYDPTHTY